MPPLPPEPRDCSFAESLSYWREVYRTERRGTSMWFHARDRVRTFALLAEQESKGMVA